MSEKRGFDRSSVEARRAAKKTSTKTRSRETSKTERAEKEVSILNGYVIMGKKGPLDFMVNPEYYSGEMKVVTEDLEIPCAHPDAEEFSFKGKMYSLGKPDKEYRKFLKEEKGIDLEIPVIYEAALFDLKLMEAVPMVIKNVAENAKDKNLVIIGKSFNHPELKDGTNICTGVIESAEVTEDEESGDLALSITTIDDVDYIVI